MSRKAHTWKELKALKILKDALIGRVKKVDKAAFMLKEQIDKPDFGFVMKNKYIGIEVCSIDNGKLFEAQKIYKSSSKSSKAKKKYIEAVSLNKPLTLTHQTTSIKRDLFERVLKNKFDLYENYKRKFLGGIFLLIHTESYENKNLCEALRFHLNHFCVEKKCPFDKVFLVDLRHKKYIGKVFEKKHPKRKLTMPILLGSLESETYVSQYFPVGRKFNIWNEYK